MDKQLWDSHTMEYYLAIKNNKVLIYSTTWINCENTMLNERSQSQKNIFLMILFTQNIQNKPLYTQCLESWLTRKRKMGENEEWLSIAKGVFLWQ